MADTPAQVALDEKGLEAATAAYNDLMFGNDADHAAQIVRAYLSSLSDKAGDDGQGALVERLDLRNGSKNMAAFPDGRYVRYSDYAALRADKERVERERDRYRNGLQVLATTFYKGNEHQDYAKHVLGNDAAERHLAEQGQAQGEATRGAAIFGEGAQARVYDVFRADPETRGDHADYYKRGVANIMRPAKDTTAYAAWLAGRHATPPSPDPDAELDDFLRRLEYSLTKDSLCEAEKIDEALGVISSLRRHRKQGGA